MARALPVVLVVAAALADAAAAPSLAFYALVLAVPAAAAAALAAYGKLIDAAEAGGSRPHERFQAVSSAAALAPLVAGTAARTPVLGEGAVPRFATSMLLLCLLALLVEAIAAGIAQMRERPGTARA